MEDFVYAPDGEFKFGADDLAGLCAFFNPVRVKEVQGDNANAGGQQRVAVTDIFNVCLQKKHCSKIPGWKIVAAISCVAGSRPELANVGRLFGSTWRACLCTQ